MAAFLSGLLGMSTEEFHFRVEQANRCTVAPFLSLYHSISPLLGLAQSPSDFAVADETFSPPTFSQPAQLSEGADGEQTHAQSDASALEISSLDSNAKPQEGELQLSICEQGLCGRGEALPRGEEEGEVSKLHQKLQKKEGDEEVSELHQKIRKIGEEGLSQNEEGGGLSEVAKSSLAGGAASIAELDRGVLEKILSCVDAKTLEACSLVCREWFEASSCARTLVRLQEGPQIAALPSLVARFTRIQTLCIEGPQILASSMIPSEPAASGLPLTEQAAIVLDDAGMGVIARGCPGLRKLELECCSGFSDAGLAVILKGCFELNELSIGSCGGFSGEAFSGLSCRLVKLELATCDGVTNDGLLAAAAACPRLREVSILSRQKNASLAKGLEGAARACPGLRTIAVHACGVSDATLRSIAASCPLLSSASLSCERAVTDGGFAAFLAALPELESLTLQHMDGLSTVPNVGSSKRLKKLQLVCWWETPDLILREVSKETNLEELHLVCCPYLTDATIDHIFAGCKGLKVLELCDNDLLTVETISAYVRNARTSRLQVRGCPKICREKLPEGLRLVQDQVFAS